MGISGRSHNRTEERGEVREVLDIFRTNYEILGGLKESIVRDPSSSAQRREIDEKKPLNTKSLSGF